MGPGSQDGVEDEVHVSVKRCSGIHLSELSLLVVRGDHGEVFVQMCGGPPALLDHRTASLAADRNRIAGSLDDVRVNKIEKTGKISGNVNLL